MNLGKLVYIWIMVFFKIGNEIMGLLKDYKWIFYVRVDIKDKYGFVSKWVKIDCKIF